ncbi:iron only hydrogenase large subunit [Desulfitobacterium dichloroeliminans LMG P-21439]|uniref:Iron only hydrogenase large subunit n=1 Tax=Desulfitobacterium dichloroeliminans (strain LMG P-21439 / DCA1) TaxID=871963 RepID=L0F5C0_DESDL|nr:[Fe-Fe] hydrogenase large subunit C-terminal domain-containing protein [Desulfitobacterium dichloroeliminans]AGA68133.1 iron only hydrogenase large subunit [Desulfitobacterium dichloroeliminans LMG P-21439]
MSHLTYEEIFGRLVKASYQGNLQEEIDAIESTGDEHTKQYIQYALGKGDPDKVVFQVKSCDKGSDDENHNCEAACLFDAVVRDMEGHVVIQDRNCTHCGECIETCSLDSLVDKKEFIPLVELLQGKEVPVFAMVAPAIIGQFGSEVTMGKLRAALKHLGFYGMVEVALFADVLSLKEALEFDEHVKTDKDFVLTSCCCPIWVSMVKKVYDKLVPHISPSVSPMVACGRGIKRMHPCAKTVFIGPCIAKKAEAKEPDIRDAVDAVLTFHELKQIFEATDIHPEDMEDIPSEHSSTSGRIYARTGGVSKSISDTLNRIRPDKPVKIKSIQADGIKECKAMLSDLMNDDIKANFYEGMGCVGGCVGGPKALLQVDKGTAFVNNYGAEAEAPTPADNQYVLGLLQQLGIDSVEELLGGESAAIFQRDF